MRNSWSTWTGGYIIIYNYLYYIIIKMSHIYIPVLRRLEMNTLLFFIIWQCCPGCLCVTKWHIYNHSYPELAWPVMLILYFYFNLSYRMDCGVLSSTPVSIIGSSTQSQTTKQLFEIGAETAPPVQAQLDFSTPSRRFGQSNSLYREGVAGLTPITTPGNTTRYACKAVRPYCL